MSNTHCGPGVSYTLARSWASVRIWVLQKGRGGPQFTRPVRDGIRMQTQVSIARKSMLIPGTTLGLEIT